MSLEISPEDLERLSNLKPHELPSTLDPAIRKQVINKMIEKRAGQPREPKPKVVAPPKKRKRTTSPTVTRDKSGKIVSKKTPIAPVGGVSPEKPKPALPVSTRKKTRTGKKLDKISGKVLRPSVRTGAGGKIEALSEEEKKAQVTTNLPTAGRDVMAPTADTHIRDISGIQSQGGEANVRGGSGNYDMLHKATHAALGHLNNAHFSIQAGMDPTHHFEAFDAIHANIKGMDKQLHQSLGAARHLVSVSGGKTTPLLRQTHAVINGRFKIGRAHV